VHRSCLTTVPFHALLSRCNEQEVSMKFVCQLESCDVTGNSSQSVAMDSSVVEKSATSVNMSE